MTDRAEVAPETASREITITRLIDAPRDLVFEAWTEAEHIARWWGPEGFTVPDCDSDPRPGGSIRIVMRGPDGTDYPMTGVYREVTAPERLVVAGAAMGVDGQPILEALNTVTFVDRDGKTEITVQARAMALVPEAVPMLGGMHAGWSQSLQCLEDVLTGAEDRQIVLSRLFEAPRELVFEAFTERKHVEQWWGPAGFTVTIHEMDVRPGGTWRFIMHGPDGVDYPNTIVYDEVASPERLVYTHEEPSFRVTVTFDDFAGITALTLRMVFATAEERDQVEAKYGAIEGGNQTLDRLGDHLAAM
jgi:uncharacterized protein YndB with AHSA1/START domain